MKETGHRRNPNGLSNDHIKEARTIYWNLTTPELYEEVARRSEGIISEHGALIVDTGEFTGRAARDKAIVREPASEKHINWGES